MDNKIRLIHNYITQANGGNYVYADIENIIGILEYIQNSKELPTHRVALMFICLNESYWQYAKPVIEDAKKFFLPGHKVEMFMWTDMPEEKRKEIEGVTFFDTAGVEWPAPTLMRYHLMLQQEEILKDFDYLYYCDIDMRIVNVVGDEVIGDLVAAQHPMYAFKQPLWIPYEPDPQSAAYIPRPGVIVFDPKTQQKKFMPMFYAGGFQGGKSDKFIEAMKEMRKTIDADFSKGYVALWNEQAHWNKYLFDNPPTVPLTPSYIYPDSLIEDYYKPLWGCDYPPKIVTLTKPFTTKKLTPEEQAQIQMKKI